MNVEPNRQEQRAQMGGRQISLIISQTDSPPEGGERARSFAARKIGHLVSCALAIRKRVYSREFKHGREHP